MNRGKALINDLQGREAQLGQAVTHPWRYEREKQAAQRLRDEAAYREGSPRRYNDVTTSGLMNDDEERWKKAREL